MDIVMKDNVICYAWDYNDDSGPSLSLFFVL